MRRTVKIPGGIAAALLSLALVACQSPATTGGAQSAKAPTKYTDKLPTSSAFNPQQITSGGDYIHRDTGLVFPEQVGRLQRIAVLAATESKDDIGATYKIAGHDDFIATVIVFPIWNVVDRPLTVNDIPAGCEEGYVSARETARNRLENPRVVREEPIATPRFKDAVFTRTIIFDADGGLELADFPIRSELHWQCGVDQVWVVLHRVSYAPDFEDAETLVQKFLQVAPTQP